MTRQFQPRLQRPLQRASLEGIDLRWTPSVIGQVSVEPPTGHTVSPPDLHRRRRLARQLAPQRRRGRKMVRLYAKVLDPSRDLEPLTRRKIGGGAVTIS